MNWAKAAMGEEATVAAYGLAQVADLLSESAIAGALITAATVLTILLLPHKPDRDQPAPPRASDVVPVAANVAFLCLGMTGIMILVSNSLARAFAIGAAISLVRFRIKLNDPVMGAALFFGVLIGMAFGVQQGATAWTLVGLYIGGLVIMTALMKRIVAREAALAPKPQSLTRFDLNPEFVALAEAPTTLPAEVRGLTTRAQLDGRERSETNSTAG